MRPALVIVFSAILLATLFLDAPASARQEDEVSLPIAVEITDRLKNEPAPKQPNPAEAAAIAAMGITTSSQCFGDDSTMTITIHRYDHAHPGTQDVVFFKETAPSSTGKATLWVAWDFLTTAFGRQDVITCDQLEYLQSAIDAIVATDVDYFGAYVQRPAGNENIDVMIYNIVDEGYFDPAYPFYIVGFFWGNVNEVFDRNMIFIDSLDW